MYDLNDERTDHRNGRAMKMRMVLPSEARWLESTKLQPQGGLMSGEEAFLKQPFRPTGPTDPFVSTGGWATKAFTPRSERVIRGSVPRVRPATPVPPYMGGSWGVPVFPEMPPKPAVRSQWLGEKYVAPSGGPEPWSASATAREARRLGLAAKAWRAFLRGRLNPYATAVQLAAEFAADYYARSGEWALQGPAEYVLPDDWLTCASPGPACYDEHAPVTHVNWSGTGHYQCGNFPCAIADFGSELLPAGTPQPTPEHNHFLGFRYAPEAGLTAYWTILQAVGPNPSTGTAPEYRALVAPLPAPAVNFTPGYWEIPRTRDDPRTKTAMQYEPPYHDGPTEVIHRDRKNRDKKERPPKSLQRLGDIYGAMTELADYLECVQQSQDRNVEPLFDPRSSDKAAHTRGGNLYDQLSEAVAWSHAIDLKALAECVASNEVEDYVIGRVNRAARRAKYLAIRELGGRPHFAEPGWGRQLLGGPNIRNEYSPIGGLSGVDTPFGL